MRKKLYSSLFIFTLLFCSDRLSAQVTNKIDSVGNVGIGTTNPTAGKLVVLGTYPQLILNNPTSGAGALALWQDNGTNGGAIGHMNTTGALQFSGFNGSTPHMSIMSGGDVGIGITNPQFKLDVNGTFHTNGQSNIGGGAFYVSTDQSFLTTAQYSFRDAVGINNPSGSSFTTATSVMSIGGMSNGNSLVTTGRIGVGLINPETLLEVYNGSGGYLQYLTGGGSSDSRFALRNETPQGQIEMDITGGSSPYAFIQTGKSENIPLRFSATEYSFENGNVGVGTNSPSEKLTVNGNIKTKKVIVTQTGWSDYVFNDDYRLRPLSEVARYIQENKHLPEVPTAREVEENGLDLGAGQAALLKKIEELTLYVIELKSENNRIQKDLTAVKLQLKKTKK